MKYFIFSIDDGTIYDKKVIKIFNHFNIAATFNLNSGLEDFVWYNGEHPIHRLKLWENRHLYDNHEVASHSLTHPHMTMCPDEIIEREVKSDIENLSNIFNREIVTFAFPFEDYDDRCIDVIKRNTNVKVIRVSEFDSSFKFPKDKYHVPITSISVRESLDLVQKFIADPEAELFVFVSHAYDFELDNTYHELEQLCEIVSSNRDIKIITTGELSEILNN
jgi:peptidoglycan/xylan/chitin deacetylase (PgdA/CDA1 family)